MAKIGVSSWPSFHSIEEKAPIVDIRAVNYLEYQQDYASPTGKIRQVLKQKFQIRRDGESEWNDISVSWDIEDKTKEQNGIQE